MTKFAASRNGGYGKQVAFAAQNALADRYGGGHFSTVASHAGRFAQFVAFARETCGEKQDLTCYRAETLERYAEALREQVAEGEMQVAYAQNLLSSVNVVAQQMGCHQLRISPSEAVGQRNNVRTVAPALLDRTLYQRCVNELQAQGLERATILLEMARETGMRLREATLQNYSRCERESERGGQINVVDGTKGGRDADRYITLTPQAHNALDRAIHWSHAQHSTHHNLLSPQETHQQFRQGEIQQARAILHQLGVRGFHDARAAYACERYQQLTGHPAPCVAGERIVDKEVDQQARAVIALELGHNRIQVLTSYIGSAA